MKGLLDLLSPSSTTALPTATTHNNSAPGAIYDRRPKLDAGGLLSKGRGPFPGPASLSGSSSARPTDDAIARRMAQPPTQGSY